MDKKGYISVRIDREYREKLAYIAEKESRSLNGLAVYIMRDYIRKFEKEHKKAGEEKRDG